MVLNRIKDKFCNIMNVSFLKIDKSFSNFEILTIFVMNFILRIFVKSTSNTNNEKYLRIILLNIIRHLFGKYLLRI